MPRDGDTPIWTDYHDANCVNEIAQRFYAEGTATPGAGLPFYYDAAGNLIQNDKYKYVYDAPAFDSRLRRREPIERNRSSLLFAVARFW